MAGTLQQNIWKKPAGTQLSFGHGTYQMPQSCKGVGHFLVLKEELRKQLLDKGEERATLILCVLAFASFCLYFQ